MISLLSLKNWRTHRDTSLEFGVGTNLIIGIMGSGKSAVLDGICYALFGTFPALKRREVSLADVISHGQTEAEVRLSFRAMGKEYKVWRKIRKTGNDISVASKLYVDGEVSDSGQARVNEMVSSALGMDYEMFTRAIYSEQNNIDYFLTIDPGRRKKEMDRLLGLDRFEDARASLVSVLNKVSSEAESLSSSFREEEYSKMKNEISEKNSRLQKVSAEEKEAHSNAEKIRAESASLSKELSHLEEQRRKSESAKLSLERAKSRKETLSSELAGKTPSQEKVNSLKEKSTSLKKEKELLKSDSLSTEKKFSEMNTLLGRISSSLEEAKSASDSLSKAKTQLESLLGKETVPSLRTHSEALEKEILHASSHRETLLAEISDLQDSLKTLKPGSAECPVCGSPLSTEKSSEISSEKNSRIKKKSEDASALEKRIPLLKKERSELEEKARKAESLSVRIAELEKRAERAPDFAKEKEKAESALLSAKEARTNLLSKIEKIEHELLPLALALREEEELLKKSELLKSAIKEQEEAQKTLDSIKFDEGALRTLRTEHEKKKVEEERALSSVKMLKKEAESLREVISILEKGIAGMEKTRAEAIHLTKLSEELSIYKNALLETQTELRSEMAGAITSAMNEVWPVLYPYADYKQLRITATEKDYFFEVYDGEWRSLESVASGGEKACLSLTLRMALSMVLAPAVGWMMLDEPTHNLDAEAVHTLSEALENKVPQIIPQSFVITHEENLLSSEFARTYKFSRNKEEGGPTIVEAL